MVASRRASMVFPEPGGPTIRRLWPPAAATSSARRACRWPRTSAKSRVGTSQPPATPRLPPPPRRVTGSAGVHAPRRNSAARRPAWARRSPATPRPARPRPVRLRDHDAPQARLGPAVDGHCEDPRRRHELARRDSSPATARIAPAASQGPAPKPPSTPIAIGRPQPRAVLAQVHRGEIHDHPPERPFEARGFDRRADPLRGGPARTPPGGRPSPGGSPRPMWASTATGNPCTPMTATPNEPCRTPLAPHREAPPGTDMHRTLARPTDTNSKRAHREFTRPVRTRPRTRGPPARARAAPAPRSQRRTDRRPATAGVRAGTPLPSCRTSGALSCQVTASWPPPKPVPAAGLHLAEHDQAAADQHQVELAERTPPVPGQQLEPSPPDVGPERGILAAGAEPEVKSRVRLGTFPDRIAAGRVDAAPPTRSLWGQVPGGASDVARPRAGRGRRPCARAPRRSRRAVVWTRTFVTNRAGR